MSRRGLGVADYCEGVLAGQRRLVAKTITLLESRRDDHRVLGQQVLDKLVPHTGGALRVGITGPPGVGKSSFIEALGLELLGEGQRVAVLAVDPSSPVSGGSILGDKTRMERLSREPNAFIRPSPSGGTLGGVAHRTREALLVCEAAGFGVVLVETVGVGQSEIEVRSMVDFFAVLLQPGAGDDLQGIKRGVLELADALVVNKADGECAQLAQRARVDYEHALQLLRPATATWRPPVLVASARLGTGIAEFWQTVVAHRECLGASGELDQQRRRQAKVWLWRLVEEGLDSAFRSDPGVAERIQELEREVEVHAMSAPRVASLLLEGFLERAGRKRSPRR
ncbi:MAG: methylmalonyl Co-A mutase-associated GTPase MeaB [Myxococcota bacterium]